jgi:hypothetical protein
MELIQQQVPDYIGNILKGYQFGQQAKANQLQFLAAQQEMDINKAKFAQAQAENILSETASTGDQNALQRLAGLNPARAEGIRKQQDYNDVQGARILDAFDTLPQYARNQKRWEQMHEEYKSATGRELPLPANFPSERNDPAIAEFNALKTRLKGREQDLKEQYQSAQIKTEGFQQGKIGVDIQKGKQDLQKGALDIMKSRGELLSAEEERAAAREQGLTVGAFKKQQEKMGELRGERINNLPKVEAQAEQALKLIDDVVSHKGKSAMVGVKNPFMGSLPFTKQAAVAGTPAAGFMAKFNQLKGKQFLEAYEGLKGGGAISEIEGKKATDAISAMDVATSEAEFDQAAKDLKDVIRAGLENQKRGIIVNQSAGSQNMSQMPRIGETIDGFTFLGGNPASQQNWRQQ